MLALPALAQSLIPVSTVNYTCAQGRSLVAEYFDGPTRTAPNGMPIPGGRVVLSLQNGAKLTLPQTVAASGIRYANEDETFVFWSKGDTAFIEEGAARKQTYSDCIGKKS